MADKKKEKPKDELHSENIQETIETRTSDYNNILGAVNAAHGHFADAVHEIVGGNYNKLDERHKDFDPNARDAVRAQADKSLNVFGKHSPVKDYLGEGAEKNFFFKKQLEQMYFPLKDMLKENIGKNYFKTINATNNASQKRMEEQFRKHAVSDIDPRKHGADLAKYIVKQSGADAKQVEMSLLERNIKDVMETYMENEGKIGKDEVYQVAGKYASAKKEEKKAA